MSYDLALDSGGELIVGVRGCRGGKDASFSKYLIRRASLVKVDGGVEEQDGLEKWTQLGD